MDVEYLDIRKELEKSGYQMDDNEYKEALKYAIRKAEVSGKGEMYIQYLLPDIIREWVIRKTINSFTLAVMEIKKIFKQEVNIYGTSDYKGVAVEHSDGIVKAVNG